MRLMGWLDEYLRAGNPKTSREQLESLAHSDSNKIRLRVAENLSTPPNVLEYLSKDQDADVRLAAATNKSSPAKLVYDLAYDPDPTVRHGLAEDPNTPLEVLEMLAGDTNPYVSCRASKTIQATKLSSSSDRYTFFSYLDFNSHGYA